MINEVKIKSQIIWNRKVEEVLIFLCIMIEEVEGYEREKLKSFYAFWVLSLLRLEK